MEKSKFFDILHRELVMAIGCTEPVAIAYAAALAGKYLHPKTAFRIKVLASGNAIKNAMAVSIPVTGITIDWDENIQTVVMKWHGYVKGDAMRRIVEKGLVLLQEKQGVKWLADLREMEVIAQIDQNWVDENWFPAAIQKGVQYIAVIQPCQVIPQLSVNHVLALPDQLGIEVENFDSLKKAKDWLKIK